MPLSSGALKNRVIGILLIALGAFALSAPLAAGRWSLGILGIPLLALSVAEAYAAFSSPQRAKLSAYLPSLLAMVAGNLLLLSSALVVGSLLVMLFAILVIDGLCKILSIWPKPPTERASIALNALVDFACAGLLWFLTRIVSAEQAIGIIIAAYITASGWRMLMAPAEAAMPVPTAGAPTIHPDPGLRLPPNEAFARLRAESDSTARTVRSADLMWMLTLGGVFLAIHVGRMPVSDTLLGIASPFVATAGDLLMTLVFAMLVVLPFRLLWRRLTRPIERLGWSLHLNGESRRAPLNSAADWLIGAWLASRFGFDLRLREARLSLSAAIVLLLRLGLPVTAFFVAFNPIWGFTWYFNTESWASGVYQKMTQLRVDPWRVSMIDAVTRAYEGGDELFRVHPDGVDGAEDFSFLVVGDPGEGDPSQYSLVSRYLKLGLGQDVKFLVVSSDVIYPAGSMHDYEANFYLPFQNFAKPIYGIPGNHDWFDALEGFNANFLEPKAARAAMKARVDADLGLTTTSTSRIDRVIAEAARLRRLYGVDVGSQRAVFFELQTTDFALLAIDTGILRTIDERQWAWIERALDRSRGKFTMAIVGHPRFAGGYDIPSTAEGQNVSKSSERFAALYQLLATHNVKIAMAGDTHDFEYYRQEISAADPAESRRRPSEGGGLRDPGDYLRYRPAPGDQASRGRCPRSARPACASEGSRRAGAASCRGQPAGARARRESLPRFSRDLSARSAHRAPRLRREGAGTHRDFCLSPVQKNP